MAKNPPTGDNHRVGAVRECSQVHNPHNDRWVKRDTETGKFMDQKADKDPFKAATDAGAAARDREDRAGLAKRLKAMLRRKRGG